jgi:hypothetical protein
MTYCLLDEWSFISMSVIVTGLSDLPLNFMRLVRDDKMLKKDRPRNTTVPLNNLGYTKTGNSDSVRQI